MFILDWVYGILASLGLYMKEAKILFLGLDNAGKTTLLSMLKFGKLQQYPPTMHPQSDNLCIGSVKFQAHDLGGHQGARRLWNDYFDGVDGIVFLVDAAEPERFPEVKVELNNLLNDNTLSNVPIVIMGNKVDMTQRAVSEDQMKTELGLYNTTGKEINHTRPNERPIEVFMISVLKKSGYIDGFKWLSQYM